MSKCVSKCVCVLRMNSIGYSVFRLECRARACDDVVTLPPIVSPERRSFAQREGRLPRGAVSEAFVICTAESLVLFLSSIERMEDECPKFLFLPFDQFRQLKVENERHRKWFFKPFATATTHFLFVLMGILTT